MYSIPVSDHRISELITWYLRVLQRAIDIIWEGIEWRYRFPRIERRKKRQVITALSKFKVPELPKSRSFKRKLRDELLLDCPYAKHWVDAVIRTAYSIIESWRKRYLRGRARKVKPRVKKRFARCKITLMKIDYKAKTIRITLKPGEYLVISWRAMWYEHRVEGWRVGEVILKDDRVLIPFKSMRIIEVRDVVAWDSNESSLDGFSPRIGFIKVNLKPLQSMKITYERKKRIAQSKGLKGIYEKYVVRERNRERDFINKLVSGLTRLFPNTIHIFENLDKEDLVSRKRIEKVRRKRNARTPWINIQKKISEKAIIIKVSPENTSRTCPQCGYVVKTRVGRLFKCPRCGIELDRQKLASINIYLKYLRMRGLPHSNDPEKMVKGELWVGVTPSGRSPVTWIPMKRGPEGCEAKGRGLDINISSPMKPEPPNRPHHLEPY
jgi:putative transposase